jgi:hypothetical protein
MPQQDINNIAEISFADISIKLQLLFKYLRSKWLPMLLVSITGGVIGIAYAWMQKPTYSAVISFSMEEDKSSVGGLAGLASQFGLDIGGVGGTFSGENILVFMESNRMLEATLMSKANIGGKEQTLLNGYLEMSEMDKGFKKADLKEIRELNFPENLPLDKYSRLQDSIMVKVVDDVRKNIVKTAKPESRLNYYTLTCKSTNEDFSTHFCNQLIKQVIDFYTETKTKRSSKIVEILQKRADSLKSAYDNALLGRAELSDANLNSAFQTPVVAIQRKQTDVTVLATAYGELLKNLEIAKFNMLKDAPLIQIIDTPMQPLEKKKLSRLLAGLVTATALVFMCMLFFSVKFIFKPQQPEKVLRATSTAL